MKNFSLSGILGRMNEKVFLSLLFLYQFLFLFQGLDFADEGFHATFYQQIFSNPESHVMNFMYWFTGIIGGTFYYFFPGLGLFGLRLQGITVVFLTMLLAYNLLKNYINLSSLRLGVLLLIIFTTNDITEIQYDSISAILNVGSAIFLFYGLKNSKSAQIAISGSLISLSMFTRIPSVAMLALFIAIVYYGFLNYTKPGTVVKQSVLFFAGFILMTSIVLMIMKIIGHLPLYIENLKIGFGWVESSDDSHSLKKLIKLFVSDYSRSLVYGIALAIAVLLLIRIDSLRPKPYSKKAKTLNFFILAAFFVIFLYALVSEKLTQQRVLSVFAGISLLASAHILGNKNFRNELKLLVVIGCLILFFAPFGSAGGLSTAGRHAMWIILPIAIDILYSTKSLKFSLVLNSGEEEQSYKISGESYHFRSVSNTFAAMSLAACLYFSYFYPYFDMSNRLKMSSTVESKLTSGIFTTQARAKVINELLSESKKYIKKGDYVLAYDNIPMFHFLTETKPYLPNTWPWLYMPEYLKMGLENAQKNIKILPVIVLNKRSTLSSNWPENTYGGHMKSDPDLKRDSIMFAFMHVNKYSKQWENDFFEIHLSEQVKD